MKENLQNGEQANYMNQITNLPRQQKAHSMEQESLQEHWLEEPYSTAN